MPTPCDSTITTILGQVLVDVRALVPGADPNGPNPPVLDGAALNGLGAGTHVLLFGATNRGAVTIRAARFHVTVGATAGSALLAVPGANLGGIVVPYRQDVVYAQDQFIYQSPHADPLGEVSPSRADLWVVPNENRDLFHLATGNISYFPVLLTLDAAARGISLQVDLIGLPDWGLSATTTI